MTAPRKRPRARYTLIEDALRQDIETGKYPIGSLLPTEHALCEAMSASRFTIRQALAGLREAGFIDARPGLGTVVIANAARQTISHTLNSFEELLRYPAETLRKQLEVQTISVTHKLAHLLSATPGQSWVWLKAMRMTRHSEAPIAWLDAYVLPEFAGVLDQPNPAGAPLLTQIEARYGRRAAQAQVEIFVGRIDADMATPMKAEVGAPALIILRRYRGDDGAVYLVTHSIHPEGRFSLNFEMARG